MTHVAVKAEVLYWAFNRSGQTVDSLQKKFPKLREWETGKSQPTLKQLERLAKVTFTPLGFFFLTKPPEEQFPVPYYRTLGDESLITPSADLLETIEMMQRRQAWMREFLIEEGQERLSFVKSVRINDSPKNVAHHMRQTLGLDERWSERQPTWTDALRTLQEAMENVGILVVVNGIVGNNTNRKLSAEEFRGFVLVDQYVPLVFVNGTDGKAAQMFTLAHELAHVFFGSSAAFDLRDMQPSNNQTEQVCNLVAAEFLISELHLRQIWSSVKNDPEPFQTIARKFKVSPLVAARRALDLGLIQRPVFLDFYRTYQIDERRAISKRTEGGDFYANQNLRIGKRFAYAIARATKEGKLLYSEAYKLTGLYGKTFDNYVTSLKFRVGL